MCLSRLTPAICPRPGDHSGNGCSGGEQVHQIKVEEAAGNKELLIAAAATAAAAAFQGKKLLVLSLSTHTEWDTHKHPRTHTLVAALFVSVSPTVAGTSPPTGASCQRDKTRTERPS